MSEETKTNVIILFSIVAVVAAMIAIGIKCQAPKPQFWLVAFQLQDFDSQCPNPKCINQFSQWVRCATLTEWYLAEMKKQNAAGKSCLLISAWPVTEYDFEKALK